MTFGTYRQYDSRWGRKNYNGSSNYATAGCGPTSCANILYAINPSITPVTTGNYMKSHGYAIRNNGTAWNGIPSCLKAFGATDVRQVDKMADVFSYCSKGYVGVFLFRGGSRGGITWTTSGHYIAVTGYKYQNGKHYFRTFDSGGRKHDGWYCYETQMRGLIPRIWLCRVSIPKVAKPTGKYSGTIATPTLKKGSKGDNVKNLQRFLNWYHSAWKLGVDGQFGTRTESAVRTFQATEGITADGIYGKNSYAKANVYKAQTPKPAPKPTPKPAPKPAAKLKSYKIVVDIANQITTVYGIYTDGTTKPIMSEFVSTAGKGHTTPLGNFKIQGASGGRKAKLRTAKMSSGKSYAEYLCRFHGGKCMHTVPYSKRQTTGHVYKGEFNKLGTPRSAGCVRMPYKLAKYIYNNCPVGTPVQVIKGTKGKYPMDKPKKYTATSNIDPTYTK